MKKALLILLIYLPLHSIAQLTNAEDVKPFCSNHVHVKTGDRELHDIVHDVLHVYDFQDLTIDVYRMPSGSDYKAMVTRVGEKHFKIYLQPTGHYSKALLHEAWHIKQMLDGDLEVHGHAYEWKGEIYTDIAYRKRHHEQEAYKESKKLAFILRMSQNNKYNHKH